MSPLGRRYKMLYDTEKPHMGCRASTYKMLFTWRYFAFVCVLLAWSLINWVWFLIMFHQTHGSIRWRFNSTSVLSAQDLAGCEAESMTIDECELFNWWFSAYTQLSDWIITSFFCVDVMLRVYCLGWRHWYAVKWNLMDLGVTAFDVVFNILQYQQRAVASVQVMRMMRFVRAASIAAMYFRIRVYKSRSWTLREVTVTAVDEDLHISWSIGGKESSDNDKTVTGPYIIDHRIDLATGSASALATVNQASPARVLDRGLHIKYLRRQSEFCFLIPVVDPENPKNSLYLHFDAFHSDIRDMWIAELNALYRKRAVKAHDESMQAVDESPRQQRANANSGTTDAVHTTSKGVSANFMLRERDEYGEPIPFIWESAVSGTIAGCYKTSGVLDEESHKGTLGVQVRPLRDVLLDYDGEVCLLRLKANWKGHAVDFEDPTMHEFLQQEITRLHELYYRRSYTCNVSPPGGTLTAALLVCGAFLRTA
jgi:hypothetical protein